MAITISATFSLPILLPKNFRVVAKVSFEWTIDSITMIRKFLIHSLQNNLYLLQIRNFIAQQSIVSEPQRFSCDLVILFCGNRIGMGSIRWLSRCWLEVGLQLWFPYFMLNFHRYSSNRFIFRFYSLFTLPVVECFMISTWCHYELLLSVSNLLLIGYVNQEDKLMIRGGTSLIDSFSNPLCCNLLTIREN